MKNEAMSIEARTVAQLEEQLACMERAILQSLQDADIDEPAQDRHEEGVYQ